MCELVACWLVLIGGIFSAFFGFSVFLSVPVFGAHGIDENEACDLAGVIDGEAADNNTAEGVADKNVRSGGMSARSSSRRSSRTMLEGVRSEAEGLLQPRPARS